MGRGAGSSYSSKSSGRVVAVGGRLAELAEVVEVGRQHSWYHGPKPDILTCLTNSCLRPLYVSVVLSISLCAGVVGSEGVWSGLGARARGKVAVAGKALAGGR